MRSRYTNAAALRGHARNTARRAPHGQPPADHAQSGLGWLRPCCLSPPRGLVIVSDKLFHEHPKWIDGVLVQNAAEERALRESVTVSVGSADADHAPGQPF